MRSDWNFDLFSWFNKRRKKSIVGSRTDLCWIVVTQHTQVLIVAMIWIYIYILYFFILKLGSPIPHPVSLYGNVEKCDGSITKCNIFNNDVDGQSSHRYTTKRKSHRFETTQWWVSFGCFAYSVYLIYLNIRSHIV